MNKIFINLPSKYTTIMLVAPTGLVNEFEKYPYGISHFLEHMHFKGTKKRTTKQIAYDIERYGGDLNAFTDSEITGYYVKIANRYMNKGFDVISDLVENCVIPEEEIDKERKVILQELKSYEDDPQEKVSDLFYTNMYNIHYPLHYPIIGFPSTLNQIGRKELLKYKKDRYNPLTLIIVGDIADCLDIKLCPTSYPKVNFLSTNKEKFIERNNLQQAQVIIGFSQFLPIDATTLFFTVALIESILNDMSGRLFTEIRENHNLVYGIRFSSTIFGNNLFQWKVSLGLEKNKINQAKELIIKELTRPFTSQEVEDAVIKSIGELELRTSSFLISNIIANSITTNIDWQRIIFNYKEEFKRVKDYVNSVQELIDFTNYKIVGLIPGDKK